MCMCMCVCVLCMSTPISDEHMCYVVGSTYVYMYVCICIYVVIWHMSVNTLYHKLEESCCNIFIYDICMIYV